jgi:hypothetical protein
MAVRTSYAGTALAGDVYTAANHARMPGGWIGDAKVTAPQAGITGETDLTGLSVAVTVGTNRRIKISAAVSVARGAGGDAALYVKEGSTYLQAAEILSSAADVGPVSTFVTLTPSAGAHTYKLTLSSLGGAAVTLNAAAAQPAMLLVEDIGPAV